MKGQEIEEKIDDLARMTANEFVEVRREMATKADLENLRTDLRQELRGDMEILFDRYIGVIRKDTDALTARVKSLEETVFPRSAAA